MSDNKPITIEDIEASATTVIVQGFALNGVPLKETEPLECDKARSMPFRSQDWLPQSGDTVPIYRPTFDAPGVTREQDMVFEYCGKTYHVRGKIIPKTSLSGHNDLGQDGSER